VYYPQKTKRDKSIKAGGNSQSLINNKGIEKALKKTYTDKNPVSIIPFMKIRQESMHPTQKPVPLLEYLIKTYTLESENVLDFTMGSGSTGVACKNLNRNFIGIERDEKYFEIAKNRIENA
jgi:DNA modification methylase